ncbi:MAG: ABC transporter permease [Acidimicrobiales bacterium]
MTRTELFKLRSHRTPWVLLATLVTSLVIAPIYYAIKNPENSQAVIETFGGVFGAVTPLIGTIFGGWLVGHEFRQGTMRRVLGNDARRHRLIATKALVGLGAFAAGMSTAAGIGALASAVSVASFGETLMWDGVVRDILSGGFMALVPAAIAFGLSILLRSDTYAMLGALALMIIVAPLLTLIPRVGKYTPSALAADVSLWISGTGEQLGVAIAPASAGLAASIGVLAGAAVVTFHRSDI